jgi:hypothetical protein
MAERKMERVAGAERMLVRVVIETRVKVREKRREIESSGDGGYNVGDGKVFILDCQVKAWSGCSLIVSAMPPTYADTWKHKRAANATRGNYENKWVRNSMQTGR